MKKLQLINLLFSLFFALGTFSALADDTPVPEGGEDEVVSYTYHVALPVDNQYGVWRFRLEMTSISGHDFNASIVGHSANGRVVLTQETDAVSGSSVFSWDSAAKRSQSLQSMEVVSDQELCGVLWFWDEQFGIMSGVSLEADISSNLVIPYIPNEDIFTNYTSFAVKGFSESGLSGDLLFGHYDDMFNYEEQLFWEGRGNRVHLTGTPLWDIILGGIGLESDVRWARLRSAFDDYKLIGYQRISREPFDNAKWQASAVELRSKGQAIGWAGLSKSDGWAFTDWFVFTNPYETEPVQLTVTLNQRVVLEPEEGEELLLDEDGEPVIQYQVVQVDVPLVLLPKERIAPTFADLFGEVEGEPLSVMYTATTIPVEASSEDEEVPVPEPRDIFALHIQENVEGSAMGAHHFQGTVGDGTSVWLRKNAEFSTQVEIYNTTEDTQSLTVTVLDENGNEWLKSKFDMGALERLHDFTSAGIFGAVAEAYAAYLSTFEPQVEGELPLPEPTNLRVNFSMNNDGNFVSKVTAFYDNPQSLSADFGIINSYMTTDPAGEPIPDEDVPNFKVAPR